jgi:hypothetical protein
MTHRPLDFLCRPTALAGCVAFALLGAAAAVADDAAVERTVTRVAKALGMTDAHIAAIKRGELVETDLKAVSDKELGLTFAAKTDAGIDWLYDRQMKGDSLDSDPAVLSHGLIGDDPRASLAKLTLPDSELDKLLEVTPGDTFNLSSVEVGELQAVAQQTAGRPAAERRRAALDSYRDLLAARVTSYRKGGLAAIAPYDRGDGESASPAEELGEALDGYSEMGAMTAEVYQALRKHPDPGAFPLETKDYWIVQQARDRPAVALARRAFGRRGEGMLSVEWRYYVGHTFNSMLVVIGMLPLDEGGSVFVYTNRTFTDQVAGFMSRAARGIGRKIMKGEIEDLYAAFQKDVDQGGSTAEK